MVPLFPELERQKQGQGWDRGRGRARELGPSQPALHSKLKVSQCCSETVSDKESMETGVNGDEKGIREGSRK